MDSVMLEKHILHLEEQVMQYDVQKIAMLLADDFLEIGSSGNSYTKQNQLDAASIGINASIKHTVTDFKIKELSTDLVLATYQTFRHHDSKRALRSSIWRKNTDTWQMVFHQGTPTRED